MPLLTEGVNSIRTVLPLLLVGRDAITNRHCVRKEHCVLFVIHWLGFSDCHRKCYFRVVFKMPVFPGCHHANCYTGIPSRLNEALLSIGACRT